MKKRLPDFAYELKLWENGFLAIGADEVGRGCLAGPLFVGAVVFDNLCKSDFLYMILSYGINDSKLLSSSQREKLSTIIKDSCLSYAIGQVSVEVINKKGVVEATQIAMRKAISNIMKKVESNKQKAQSPSASYILPSTNYFLLADAFHIKHVKGIGMKNQKAIIHGDRISISIAAASIIAKVERDKFMDHLSLKHPQYLWHKNKGYGTREHIVALKKYGKTSLHRELFIRNILCETATKQ